MRSPENTPFAYDTLVGFQHDLAVPERQCVGGINYTFVGWAHSPVAAHRYRIEETTQTLTAHFIQSTCPLPDGIVMHLDAGREVQVDESNKVVRWSDLSTADNDVFVIQDAPTLIDQSHHGNRAVRFDGIDDVLGLSSQVALPLGAADRSVFLVANYDDASGTAFSYGQPAENGAFGVGLSPTGHLNVQAGADVQFDSTTLGTNRGWLAQSVFVQETETTHYANGQLIDSFLHEFDTSDGVVHLGANAAASNASQVNIAELIVFNRVLTDEERHNVDSALAARHLTAPRGNLPVVTNDRYEWFGEELVVDGIEMPTLLSNDTDSDADPLTVHLLAGPQFGMLSLSDAGTFTYTRDANGARVDEFFYYVTDGTNVSNVGVVTLVNVANLPPIAADENYELSGDAINTLQLSLDSLLRNDIDPDGDQLTVQVLIPPQHGTVTLLDDGHFLYVHDGSAELLDEFTYTVSDGINAPQSATARISIVRNHPPVAVDDAYAFAGGILDTAQSDTALSLLQNDSDRENDPISIQVLDPPTHGILTLLPDGNFTYIHDRSPNLLDQFTYQVADPYNLPQTATVTLVISPNMAPVPSDDSYNVPDTILDTTLLQNGSLLANDRDDENDVLTIQVVTPPRHGTLALFPDGNFIYEHDESAVRIDRFVYRIADPFNPPRLATVTLNVGPNDLRANNWRDVAAAELVQIQLRKQGRVRPTDRGNADRTVDNLNPALPAERVVDLAIAGLKRRSDGANIAVVDTTSGHPASNDAWQDKGSLSADLLSALGPSLDLVTRSSLRDGRPVKNTSILERRASSSARARRIKH